MPSVFMIGTERILSRIKGTPELLEIDKEIDRPYMTKPLLYSSQAWSRKLELPWVLEQIGEPEGLAILDVGSGRSSLPIFLARHQAKVVSVDPAEFAGTQDRPVGLVRAALPHLPFRDGTFDIVCCVSVLEHLGVDIPEHIAELCRVSRNSVLLTFDIALGPLATFGLSRPELESIAEMVGDRLFLPDDVLVPTREEKGIWAHNMGVCLLHVKKEDNKWPILKIGNVKKLLMRFHRAEERLVGLLRYNYWRIFIRPSRQA